MADTKRVFDNEEWCATVTDSNDALCWNHMVWAVQVGEKEDPEWYPTGMNKTNDADVQCALFLKVGDGDPTNQHNCTKPSCADLSVGLASNPAAKNCLEPKVTVEAEKAEPSMPVWGWVLIGLGVVAIIGFAVFMFMGNKKPKKKKRAVAAVAEPVQTTAAPVPQYEIAPPIYTYAAAPVETIVAPPVYLETVTAPATRAAEQVVYSAPEIIQAAPQVVYVEGPITEQVYTTTGGSVGVPTASIYQS